LTTITVGDRVEYTSEKDSMLVNPLANPVPWWYEFYKRIKLLPWWFRYNIGIAEEAVLKDKIVDLGANMGLQDKWLKMIVRHAVSEFSKKGLGADYYGYHNIDHELQAAYFTLLAADGQRKKKFSKEDINYLFVAALFHDYDPLKEFDKPHEDAVERFIRNDDKIKKFIDDVGINIDLVIAIIYRTAYPFKNKIAEQAGKRMQELFTSAGIAENDTKTRKHYEDLGWFLSVAERVAGYALGDFERAKELARRNAHALGWHPSVINEESVKYFSALKDESAMVERVLEGIKEEYKKIFWDNVEAFRESWEEEIGVRNALRRNELAIISVPEKTGMNVDPFVQDSILKLYRELPIPLRIDELKFKKLLYDFDTILMTLRIDNSNGNILGYAKGAPLEKYELRRGTIDENIGDKNTIYLEQIGVKSTYWGGNGGHLLRLRFLSEAKHRGYKFVTGYAHRNVIMQRVSKGESIEIVQKYDPDKLDYYRYDLSKLSYQEFYPYEGYNQ
jgi:hypothetical protein